MAWVLRQGTGGKGILGRLPEPGAQRGVVSTGAAARMGARQAETGGVATLVPEPDGLLARGPWGWIWLLNEAIHVDISL